MRTKKIIFRSFLTACLTLAIGGAALHPAFAQDTSYTETESASAANTSAPSLSQKESAENLVKASANNGGNLGKINQVIKLQLDAIRSRNDRLAFEMQSTQARESFRDPQSFMRSLRREKTSLYEHVSYEILTPNVPNPRFYQVRLTDRFGNSAIALFRVETDSDDELRVRDIVLLNTGSDPI
ncbi:MAG: DUF4864 domain-containing protein [Alphaproteobacteria bacterium]